MAVREDWISGRALAGATEAGATSLGVAGRQRVLSALGLALVVLVGAGLRFYQLGAYSIGNTYYAATVQSMLTSWHNFFFASFEPGGSVTVDKPPLGFWVQAVSAFFLGVNGFALALPQALAGVLSIPLLYVMVRRQFGVVAGLMAALALATLPVTVSTERNNTIDGLLVFVLLLAAWATWQSVTGGRFRYLLLGALLVGLGFNIKMLQAFMPLPALYALYLVGAPHSWGKRLLHLAGATGVLLAVSLAWAVVVDLTPPQDRPFVGSSADNSVMELIVGHNGLRRLTGASGPRTGGAGGPAGIGQPPASPPARPNPPPAGQFPPGPPPFPPDGPAAAADRPAGGNPVRQEVGEAGAVRLFSEPLVTEAGWLLPLVLPGLALVGLVLVRRWQWPLRDRHLAVVLWAGWLLPELLYFSFTTGLFHAYYLIMLGPPLAALAGATAWALARVYRQRRWPGWVLAALLTGGTVAFQAFTLRSYPEYAGWMAAMAGAVWLAGALLLAWRPRPWSGRAALALMFVSLTIVPLAWSALTALNVHPDVALPRSGPGQGQPARRIAADGLSPAQSAVLDFLLANTEPDAYLVATLNARDAAPFILETQRPVLTFGGFSGSDPVVDVEELARMVAEGELRFVLAGPQLERQKPEIAGWVAGHCTPVTIPGATQPRPAGGPGDVGQSASLFDCAAGGGRT